RHESWEVFVDGGRTPTGRDALHWAEEAVSLGAGELLVTSMDRDGTQGGDDVELLRELGARVPVPVIASRGAGSAAHAADALEAGAEGALAASIFHDATFSVEEVKAACRERGLPMR